MLDSPLVESMSDDYEDASMLVDDEKVHVNPVEGFMKRAFKPVVVLDLTTSFERSSEEKPKQSLASGGIVYNEKAEPKLIDSFRLNL